MLSLNPTCSQFRVGIPIGFIPDHIREKYNRKISKYNNQIMKDIAAIIEESVAEVTLFGLSSHIAEQAQATIEPAPFQNTSKSGYNYKYITAQSMLAGTVNLEFSITFRITSGFLNYFAMMETLMYYHSLFQSAEFVSYPLIQMQVYNEYKEQIGTVKIFNVIPDSMESITFSRSKDPGRESFTVNFVANNIDIDLIDPTLDEPGDLSVLVQSHKNT